MLSSKLYIYYHWALDFFNDKDNARKEELVIEYEGMASPFSLILGSPRFTAISHDKIDEQISISMTLKSYFGPWFEEKYVEA